jgi:hypothetical protein
VTTHERTVEISVKGELEADALAEFDDVAATTDRGVTRLRTTVRDDSALYGLLDRLQASGFEVLAVYPLTDLPDNPPQPPITR